MRLPAAFLAAFILSVSALPAQAAKFGPVTDNGSVGKYEKFEITFTLNQTYLP